MAPPAEGRRNDPGNPRHLDSVPGSVLSRNAGPVARKRTGEDAGCTVADVTADMDAEHAASLRRRYLIHSEEDTSGSGHCGSGSS
jgi:hypothetical protein